MSEGNEGAAAPRPRPRSRLVRSVVPALALALVVALVQSAQEKPPEPEWVAPTVPGTGAVGALDQRPTLGTADRTDEGAGARSVGTTAYPVPADAVHVATDGDDAASGTATRPLRTIQAAADRAAPGQTIVVHEGRYRESVVLRTPGLVLQSAPREEVWLDSSRPVTGWVRDGAAWRADGWTPRFDASPTHTKGAPDNTEPGWRFLHPDRPLAAHPDMLLRDGRQLRQVAAATDIAPGTFALDEDTSTLWVGDDPQGHVLEGATLPRALQVVGADTRVRGIGVRRYAPSVWHIGGVIVEGPRSELENVVVEDLATTGLSIQAEGVTVRSVTVRRCGMLGLHARHADNLTLSQVNVTRNNLEGFHPAPTAGGAKLGKLRGVRVSESDFSLNEGTGLWTDQSVRDIVVAGSVLSENAANGLFLEISGRAVVVGNLVARNTLDGIKINNTSDVRVWNNTVLGDGRPLDLVQDARRNTDRSDPAVDARQSWPDPSMPWTLGPVEVRNNVLVQTTANAECVLCVEDYSFARTAEEMGVSSDHNLFARPSTAQPRWLVVWSRGTERDPATFTSLDLVRAATGEEEHSVEVVGEQVVTDTGVLRAPWAARQGAIAAPLPADLALLVGADAGERRLGRW